MTPVNKSSQGYYRAEKRTSTRLTTINAVGTADITSKALIAGGFGCDGAAELAHTRAISEIICVSFFFTVDGALLRSS